MASNQLEKLKEMSIVVADTGDFRAIEDFSPQDSTTNPSLIFAASKLPQYKPLLLDAVAFAKGATDDEKERMNLCVDRVCVNFGVEILKIVPGYVSTEVDARLSFDTEGTLSRARRIIEMYEEQGIKRDRVLIKIASTWEGIQAAKILEAEGIHCNLTLLFSFEQAVACANAKATLISPFVGRILDYQKKKLGVDSVPADEDMGVISVRRIFKYYKGCRCPTIIMGASFRSKFEILALSGCDRLTIAPKLLKELADSKEEFARALTPEECEEAAPIELDEKTFRWKLNEDAMATEKLAEGIRNFAADLVKLEKVLEDLM